MHGLDLYDYGARFYDPGLGRFTTIDPLAEKYYSISPYAYCANNPVNALDPDGREIWIYYQDKEGKEQKMLYTAGMEYKGTDKFVSQSIFCLNMINKYGGSKMMSELISSPNSFNMKNQLPVDSKGRAIEGALQFDENASGGGNIYAGSLMNPKIDNFGKIESTSHEFFHGLQYEKGQGKTSIFNEVEANVYSNIIATEWFLQTGEVGVWSSNGVGTISPEGVKYKNAFDNLKKTFTKESFIEAVKTFVKGSESNASSLYNRYPLQRGNQKVSILKQYYPR